MVRSITSPVHQTVGSVRETVDFLRAYVAGYFAGLPQRNYPSEFMVALDVFSGWEHNLLLDDEGPALARETPRVYLADGTPQPLPGMGQEVFFTTCAAKRGQASVVYYREKEVWYEIRSAQSRGESRNEPWVLRQVNSATAMIYFVNYGPTGETSQNFRRA
ncbi:MAG: hypothetical protein Q7S65_01795, partial [Nanoarchaeota archaeon]|nr:hypothetical protein [Nanoarchaeota archaeon]